MLNEQTFEFGQARLKIKDSLRFSMRPSGCQVEYLIEDEVSGRFFRIGLAEYTFLTMLDGTRTVSTVLMKTATLMRERAISENEAATLCKWAIESGLIVTEQGSSAERREQHRSAAQKQKMVSWLNPLMMRFPLFNPDPLISVITHYTGFLISPIGCVIWFVVVAWGGGILVTRWQDFFVNRIDSFSAVDAFWFMVTWMALKVIHELGHAVACKRFGGRVHSCGLLFMLLIPMPFMDVTTAWRFDNKWKRIFTSAAGILAELFIAAIAVWVWSKSNPGPLRYHAENVIVSATLVTLLFNINPLMRFDGYYMLADLLEIPNLATHGRQWLKSKLKWLYFGATPPAQKETGLRGLAVRLYGILSTAWFFSVTLGLTLAASSLIEGFGLLVALISCGIWVGIPLLKLARYVIWGTDFEQPNRLRFAAAAWVTLGMVGGMLIVCPSPTVVSAPVVIDFDPVSVVRANASGFATQIHVTDGQRVETGDLLMTLENPELEHQLASLAIDISISNLRSNTLVSENRISEEQLEQQSLESLVKRKSELAAQINNLKVRAPQSGVIMARELDSKRGKYFEPGNEILSIGQPGSVKAVALTTQADVDWVQTSVDTEMELWVWGRHQWHPLTGKVKQIDPRASEEVPHDAFAASVGGPLAVVPRSQVHNSPQPGGDTNDVVLTQPRVAVEISLSPDESARLLSGQTGLILARSRNQSMGSFLMDHFVRFVRRNNHRTHGL